jgi:hypothetical protein
MGKPEGAVENRLREAVRAAGGKAYKLRSPGNNGMPDRLVCIGGRTVFVELKADGGKLSKTQRLRIEELRRLGQDARVLTGAAEVDKFLEEIECQK